jgi:hypothetical protein
MAMEKPIILGVEGESAELVIASGGGVCVEPENGKDLADQILKLYQDPARCKELGTHGRHYVLAHFDRQVLARKLSDPLRRHPPASPISWLSAPMHNGYNPNSASLHEIHKNVGEAADEDSPVIRPIFGPSFR